jgi:RND family efflux transporter MFP subunit
MNKTKAAIAAAVLVGAAVGGGLYMKGAGPAQASSPDAAKAEPELVFSAQEVSEVRSLALASQIAFSGPLVAPDTAVVKAKAAGTLLSLAVVEGARVRRGDVLGTLDLSDLQSRLSERQALVEAARAGLAQAERTHASNQQLADQQFISPIALETSRAALQTARAQLGAAQAQADTVRVALRDAALVAPIDGIVSQRQAVPGEKLAAEQPVLSVVNLRRLEMVGKVGTHEVSRLKVGMPVQLQIEGEAATVTARLDRIAPSAEAGTRAIGVVAVLDNPDERWRAGQFVLARVSLPGHSDALAVPVTAVGSGSGQEYVWTLEQGKLWRRTVTTGRRDGERGLVEVLKGLQPGTLVLAASFDKLREGAPARVGTVSAAAAASAPASAAR